jgi:predicted TIM-barrel fold metal-dependent hydrolase
MEQIVAEVPLEQIIFGTDGGLFNTARQPYVDYRFREFDALEIPQSAKLQILGPNALRLLGKFEPGGNGHENNSNRNNTSPGSN